MREGPVGVASGVSALTGFCCSLLDQQEEESSGRGTSTDHILDRRQRRLNNFTQIRLQSREQARLLRLEHPHHITLELFSRFALAIVRTGQFEDHAKA